ncbi:MAG: OmpA family protein [Oscillospiraceae bacterium]|nr:OmpA family protein [Oscillospiraceae bacterium]
MKQKKKPQEEAPAIAEWMNTYCDMVTLLFAFFVLLFAISQVDAQKFAMLAFVMSNRGATLEQIEAIGQMYDPENAPFDLEDPRIDLPLGPDEITDPDPKWIDIHEYITASIMAAGMSDSIVAYLGDDYIFIQFLDDVLFNPNSSALRPQSIMLIDAIGNALLSIEDEIGMIRINGHTAAIPGLSPGETYHVSDRLLSSARADAVLMRFEDYIGIEGKKLTALSFGKNFPIDKNDTEEGRIRNRRIEIVVTEPATQISLELGEIYADLGLLSD